MMGQISIKNFQFLNEYSMKFSREIYGKIVEPTVEFRYLKQKIILKKSRFEEQHIYIRIDFCLTLRFIIPL